MKKVLDDTERLDEFCFYFIILSYFVFVVVLNNTYISVENEEGKKIFVLR